MRPAGEWSGEERGTCIWEGELERRFVLGGVDRSTSWVGCVRCLSEGEEGGSRWIGTVATVSNNPSLVLSPASSEVLRLFAGDSSTDSIMLASVYSAASSVPSNNEGDSGDVDAERWAFCSVHGDLNVKI